MLIWYSPLFNALMKSYQDFSKSEMHIACKHNEGILYMLEY